MKRLLTVLICFALGILTAQAQRGGQQRGQGMSPELRAEMMTNMMQERLDLSTEQVEKIHKVNLARINSMEMNRGSLRPEAANKKAGAKQKGKAVKEVEEEIKVPTEENFDKEIEDILNPEQKTKWEEIKTQRGASGQQGGQRLMRGGMNRGGGDS